MPSNCGDAMIDEHGAMTSRCVRPLLSVLVLALVAAGCGSGAGSTNPSSVSRPPGASTVPDRTDRPPATVAATDAPAAPTTERVATPTPPPATTSSADGSDESTSTWWPWVLLALAVIAVVIGVIALVRRPPKSTPPVRTSPTAPTAQAAVFDQSDEITTHLVGLAPGGLGSVAAGDADRLARLLAALGELMMSTSDESSRRALAALQDSMRTLHAALDAIALAPHLASDEELDEIRARATAVHSATALARASVVPRPPG